MHPLPLDVSVAVHRPARSCSPSCLRLWSGIQRESGSPPLTSDVPACQLTRQTRITLKVALDDCNREAKTCLLQTRAFAPPPLIRRSSVWAPPAFADAFSVSDIFPSSESLKCFVGNQPAWLRLPSPPPPTFPHLLDLAATLNQFLMLAPSQRLRLFG